MIREELVSRSEISHESPAYRSGWQDGRFGSPGTFVANVHLAVWTDFLDRLAYYHGHRDGRRVREMLGVGDRAV